MWLTAAFAFPMIPARRFSGVAAIWTYMEWALVYLAALAACALWAGYAWGAVVSAAMGIGRSSRRRAHSDLPPTISGLP
jgi:hypothetical protein